MGPARNASLIATHMAFWQQKPWWCQPWSILATGFAGGAATLLAYWKFQIPLWLVAPVLAGILGWWLLFLVLVPSNSQQEPAYKQEAE